MHHVEFHQSIYDAFYQIGTKNLHLQDNYITCIIDGYKSLTYI